MRVQARERYSNNNEGSKRMMRCQSNRSFACCLALSLTSLAQYHTHSISLSRSVWQISTTHDSPPHSLTRYTTDIITRRERTFHRMAALLDRYTYPEWIGLIPIGAPMPPRMRSRLCLQIDDRLVLLPGTSWESGAINVDCYTLHLDERDRWTLTRCELLNVPYNFNGFVALLAQNEHTIITLFQQRTSTLGVALLRRRSDDATATATASLSSSSSWNWSFEQQMIEGDALPPPPRRLWRHPEVFVCRANTNDGDDVLIVSASSWPVESKELAPPNTTSAAPNTVLLPAMPTLPRVFLLHANKQPRQSPWRCTETPVYISDELRAATVAGLHEVSFESPYAGTVVCFTSNSVTGTQAISFNTHSWTWRRVLWRLREGEDGAASHQGGGGGIGAPTIEVKKRFNTGIVTVAPGLMVGFHASDASFIHYDEAQSVHERWPQVYCDLERLYPSGFSVRNESRPLASYNHHTVVMLDAEDYFASRVSLRLLRLPLLRWSPNNHRCFTHEMRLLVRTLFTLRCCPEQLECLGQMPNELMALIISAMLQAT